MFKNFIGVFQILFLVFGCFNMVKADGVFIPFEGEDLWEPSQTAFIVHRNGREDLYLKVGYEGAVNKFAWIVPTPTLPEVAEVPEKIFEELHEITMPKVLYSDRWSQSDNTLDALSPEVVVHSRQQVGIYDIAVLSAADSAGLYNWLQTNGYQVPEEARDLFDWYIAKGWYFSAMRVEPEAKVDMFLKDLREKFGNKIDLENAPQLLADRIFEEYRTNLDATDSPKNKKLQDTYLWLRGYDDNVRLDFYVSDLDYERYLEEALGDVFSSLENHLEGNIKQLCFIINYDLLENQDSLRYYCGLYDNIFDDSANNDNWRADKNKLKKLGVYEEFQHRMLDLKNYYIENLDLANIENYGQFGFINDGYASRTGFKVAEVISSSPAEKAGLLAGDYIVAIDRQSILGISDTDRINTLLQGRVGEQSTLEIKRGTRKINLDITRYEDISLADLAERIKDKQIEMIRAGVQPENNGRNLENSFYKTFIKNIFERNQKNLEQMCIEQAHAEDRESFFEIDGGGNLFLDFNYVSCQKVPGTSYEDNPKINYPNFSCQTKEERGMYDWFDDCAYQYYFDQISVKNEVDHWFSIRNKLEEYLDDYQEVYGEGKEVNKYSDFLHPIKFSFESEELIYPLKISQFSTRVPDDLDVSLKTNEVLLYVLADCKVSAPEFRLEYADWIDKSSLGESEDYLSGVREILGDSKYFLTKLRRSFARIEMDDDLLISQYTNNDSYRLEIKEYGGDDLLDISAGELLPLSQSNEGEISPQQSGSEQVALYPDCDLDSLKCDDDRKFWIWVGAISTLTAGVIVGYILRQYLKRKEKGGEA